MTFQQKDERLKLDCIYDNSPSGFEKPLSPNLRKMESQDPLEEIHIETEDDQRPTYVSKLLDQGL